MKLLLKSNVKVMQLPFDCLIMTTLLVIIFFYFKYSECLNCSYVEDNILGMSKWIQVTSLLDQNLTSYRYSVEQSLPKFCTQIKPVLTLKSFSLFKSNTSELGQELFKNYNLHVFEAHHNNIKVIHSFTFLNVTLRKVYLSHNHIELIEEEAFKDLYNLEDVDLSNNKLKSINSNMFVNLIKLIEFDLADNLIKVLGTNDLNFLRGRRLLNLNFCCNSMKVLHPKSMSNLTLQNLYINRNCLTDFQEDVFQYSCIEFISVSDNNLSQFSESGLRKICNLSVMEYNNNNNKDEEKHKIFDGQIIIVVAVYIVLNVLILIAYCIYNKIYK